MIKDSKSTRKIWIAVLLLALAVGIIVWLRENQGLLKKTQALSVDDAALIKTIQSNHTKLLIIGLDGASWQIIIDLIGRNQLPNLRKLIEQGSRGIMLSEEPMISPALWTSFATGVPREKHKIDNFVFKPAGSYETETMDSRVRESPALWEILSHYGKKVAVINWNSASPAEKVNGLFIGDGARRDNLSPENVYPAEWIEKLKALPELRIEWFEEELKKWNHPMPAKGYQEDIFIASAGVEILKREQPDLVMIYLRNIDMVSHLFWKYRWPIGLEYQFSVSGEEQARLGDVIEKYYEFTDELVGMLLDASPGYTVMVFSDHGQSATYVPKNIFLEINNLLNRLGYLTYKYPRCEDVIAKLGQAQENYPEAEKRNFFDCQELMRRGIVSSGALIEFLLAKKRIKPEEIESNRAIIDELLNILAQRSSLKEINWSRTKLYNIDDFHKNVRGVYINLKARDREGVVEYNDYYRFRKEAVKLLKSLRSDRGDRVFRMVKENPEKEPVSKGVIDAPDIFVEFNPEIVWASFIYGTGVKAETAIYIPEVLWSYQDVSGDHSLEGIIIISGKNAVAGQRISASIYDVAPTILWLFDAGIGEEMRGKVLEYAFNLPEKEIKYVADYADKIKIPVSWKPKAMSQEEKEKLKAVGYIK